MRIKPMYITYFYFDRLEEGGREEGREGGEGERGRGGEREKRKQINFLVLLNMYVE